jgi:hypothetical protein
LHSRHEHVCLCDLASQENAPKNSTRKSCENVIKLIQIGKKRPGFIPAQRASEPIFVPKREYHQQAEAKNSSEIRGFYGVLSRNLAKFELF